MAAAERRPFPDPAAIERISRGSGRVTAAAAGAFDAVEIGTAIQRRIGVKTSRDEPLARFTTMRVGGPADLFATVHNVHELRAIVRFARSREIPLTLLGRGSDVVIADAGVRGLVVQNRAEGSRIDADNARYTAESGVPMARAATETQKAGLTGLEFGLAIPGTVGGAVWANAGAHENDVAAIIDTADVLLADGTEARLAAADLDLRYRDSRFKAAPGEVVLNAAFRLEAADPPTIASRLDEIRKWRREHQPLGIPSAGSAFRNPPGDSAGRLIDDAGLKGYRVGGAAISEKHANFIVNDAKGTAADVRAVLDRARDEVRRRTGDRAGAGDRVPRRLGSARRDRRPGLRPCRSSSSSAARRRSTTCRSFRGRPSPRPSPGPATPSRQILIDLAGRWWRLPADHRRDGRPAVRVRRSGGARRRAFAYGRRGHRPDRRGDACAGRLHRPARPVRRGRHGPGPARGGRPRLHRLRRRRIGDRHGQGDLQAASPAGSACRSSTGSRSGPPAGRRIARRCSASSTPSPRAPATRG